MAEENSTSSTSSNSSSLIVVSSSSTIEIQSHSSGQNGCRIQTSSPQPQFISTEDTTFLPFRSFFPTLNNQHEHQQQHDTNFQVTSSTDSSYNDLPMETDIPTAESHLAYYPDITPSTDSHVLEMEIPPPLSPFEIAQPLSPFDVYIPDEIPPPMDLSHVIPLLFDSSNDSLPPSIHSDQPLHPDHDSSESSNHSQHSDQPLHPDHDNSESSNHSQHSHSQSNRPTASPRPDQLPIQADDQSDLSNASTVINNNIPRGGLDDLFEQYYQERFLIFMARYDMCPEE